MNPSKSMPKGGGLHKLMNLAPAVRDFIFFSGSKGFILEDKKSIIINKN